MKEMIIRIWEKWFGPKTGQVKNTTKKETVPSPMLQRLETYLFGKYYFRFNVLTEQTEYSIKDDANYQMVDQRTLNTFCIEARSKGINCWDKDVSRLLLSKKIKDFHPFLDYTANLPVWDGIDRVTELAQRISDKPLWVNGFHHWMLGMVAQWMQLDAQCANAVAPLLISTEQGRCKSTLFDI